MKGNERHVSHCSTAGVFTVVSLNNQTLLLLFRKLKKQNKKLWNLTLVVQGYDLVVAILLGAGGGGGRKID